LSNTAEALLMAVSVAIGLGGIALAWRFYMRDPLWALPKRISMGFSPVRKLLENKYYVDEFYNATVIRGTLVFANILWWIDANIIDGLVNFTRDFTVVVLGYGSSLFDKYVVDGAVNGVAATAKGGSSAIRRMQSGLVQNYALIMGGGIVLLAVVYLFMKP